MSPSPPHRYLIALGSNRRHHRFGDPRRVLLQALSRLEAEGIAVLIHSKVVNTKAIGPSLRRFANSAAIVETVMAPESFLELLKTIEGSFGSRRGQAWSQRTLDLDIILWSGGSFASPYLLIPHPLFRLRDFVLAPASEIAPDWIDPLTHLGVRQLLYRNQHRRPKMVDPAGCAH